MAMPDSPTPAQSQIFRLRPYSPPSPEALWQTLYYFNIYRLILGGVLVFLFGMHRELLQLGQQSQALFYHTSIAYALSVLVSLLGIKLRKPGFSLQLAAQVGIDIACIAVLTYAAGGVQSGLGILLMVSLAAAGMISRGRITLFFAAIASITMLLEHFYAVLTADADIMQYFQVGLLSTAYFAVAWSAHTLAKYAVASERLATQRGAELASMAEANRLVIQGLPDGVLVVDESGAIRQYNPSAERLLGCDLSGKAGTTLQLCAPRLAEMFSTWHADSASVSEGLRLPSSDSLVRVRFLPVRQEDFGGALLILEDMQRIQAQARQIKLAALGRLTANIAHEIRNPLSAISYAVELFREEKEGPAQDRLMDIIIENTRRLNSIVQDVMQLNRRDRAQPEPMNLGEELNTFVRDICQAEHAPLAMFDLAVQGDCEIMFDRGHLNQILWNLCSNAMRYCTRQSASVRLTTEKTAEGLVRLEVSDDGAGVSPAMEQQLFEPFFTTESNGTGLGLYIARELCEANGAMLEYVRRPERGAGFRITFGGTGEH